MLFELLQLPDGHIRNWRGVKGFHYSIILIFIYIFYFKNNGNELNELAKNRSSLPLENHFPNIFLTIQRYLERVSAVSMDVVSRA